MLAVLHSSIRKPYVSKWEQEPPRHQPPTKRRLRRYDEVSDTDIVQEMRLNCLDSIDTNYNYVKVRCPVERSMSPALWLTYQIPKVEVFATRLSQRD
jgi:hypothetical protein